MLEEGKRFQESSREILRDWEHSEEDKINRFSKWTNEQKESSEVVQR